MTRTVRWLLAALVLAAVVIVAGFVQLAAQADDLERVVEAEEAEERVEAAERCVGQHDRVALLRDVIGRSTGAGAHAAVVAVGTVAERLVEPGGLPPDLLDQLASEANTIASEDAAAILDDYPSPACDLDAARRVLEATD